MLNLSCWYCQDRTYFVQVQVLHTLCPEIQKTRGNVARGLESRYSNFDNALLGITGQAFQPYWFADCLMIRLLRLTRWLDILLICKLAISDLWAEWSVGVTFQNVSLIQALLTIQLFQIHLITNISFYKYILLQKHLFTYTSYYKYILLKIHLIKDTSY